LRGFFIVFRGNFIPVSYESRLFEAKRDEI